MEYSADSGELSPWGMFLAADPVVQSVMVGLALASVLVWTVFIAKSIELARADRNVKRALVDLAAGRGVAHIKLAGVAQDLSQAAHAEIAASLDEGLMRETKDRVASALERIAAREARRMGAGLGLVATIAATAPFVGLFGTVWGIMNSFVGISAANTTNLAVVAPGIAEALLATACGLAAAIPAVVVYNHFSRAIGGYKICLLDLVASVQRAASRDLERREASATRAIAAE
jgi:biopolymer transport protein ExbB